MIRNSEMIRNNGHLSAELPGFCLFWIMDHVFFSAAGEGGRRQSDPLRL